MLLAVSALVFAAFIIYGFRPFIRWKLRHIPGPKPGWLFGNLPEIVQYGKHEAFRRWADKYGSIYKVLQGGVPTVVIQHHELARWVNSRLPNRHPIPYMETGEEEKFNAAGILFARNAHHRGLRGAWQPMFHKASLEGFMPLMLSATGQLKNSLNKAANNKEFVDIWKLFGDFTMHISGASAFGTALSGDLVQPAKAFFDAAGRIENVYALLQLAFPEAAPLVRILATNFPTPEYKQAMQGRRTVRAAVGALLHDQNSSKHQDELGIDTKDKNLNHPGVAPGSFLDLMIRSTNKETGNPFTEMEIICQAFSFVLAAYETTTAALAFAVYLLCLNEEKKARMVAEIDDVLGRQQKAITFETLHEQFPYVEAVFKETLRLFPPVPLTIREADRQFQLGGVNIPEGTHLAVSVYGLHHSKEYWQDPKAFIPERFLQGHGKNVDQTMLAYMPFGEGPRGCIGQRYAWQEAMIALISLYREYDFELEAGQVPLAVRMSLSLGPKDGVKVLPRKRGV